MKCADFQRALDAAGARALAAEARAHAVACESCAHEQALALEVEARLATQFDVREAMPGADFTDAIMARVERMPRAVPERASAWRDGWTQAGIAAAFGLAASALLASVATNRASDWLGAAVNTLGSALEQPSALTLAVLASAVPLVAVAAIAAWRLGESLADSPRVS